MIFDEGHNLEDVSRSAASAELSLALLKSTAAQLEMLAEAGTVAFRSLFALVNGLAKWLEAVDEVLFSRVTSSATNSSAAKYPMSQAGQVNENIWEGSEILDIFEDSFGLNESTLMVYWEHFKTVMSEQEDVVHLLAGVEDDTTKTRMRERPRGKGKAGVNDNKSKNKRESVGSGSQREGFKSTKKAKLVLEYEEESNEKETQKDNDKQSPDGDDEEVDTEILPTATSFVIKNILTVFRFMLKDNKSNAGEYKITVQRQESRRRVQSPPSNPRGRFQPMPVTQDTVLSFLCLSASVAFVDLAKDCRSVLVTSGTLSPLDSFSGKKYFSKMLIFFMSSF